MQSPAPSFVGTALRGVGAVLRVLAMAALALVVRPPAASAADVAGGWGLEFQRDDDSPLYQAECTFKQEGNRLAGSCLSGFESTVPVRGAVDGARVTFQFAIGLEDGTVVSFSGLLDAGETSMTGTWRFVDRRGSSGEGTFRATRR